MKVDTDDRGRGDSVDRTALAAARENGIAVPTIDREAERRLRCDLEE